MMEVERDSPVVAHWSRQQYENLFVADTSHSSERLAWLAEGEAAEPEKTFGNVSGIVGFVVARRVDADWELENIVVRETARRSGIGMGLLNELVAHARSQNGNSIFLEVRESNCGARALYKRAGFEETGLRKSYYSGPQENAILCRLSLY